MKTTVTSYLKTAITLVCLGIGGTIMAQTNVYDDIIATSSNHTYLKAAIDQEGLDDDLQNGAALTVFAPDNEAFDSLAARLNTNIAGLLALPNLDQILLYHVLGAAVESGDITNGDIATPLNTDNTIKLTKTSGGMVYANHSMVEAADLTADNGVVHSMNEVLLPSETVVDVALDNGFSTLATAVITAELLPALTNPFADLTVFAPTNDAFDSLAVDLGLTLNDILGLPNLADILTYHVLGSSVAAADINNGDVVDALSTTNTLKLTKTSGGMVYINQAMVTTADVPADNGLVHVLDAVVLPNETVVDVAIDQGFTTLTTAVITAELLPALVDPFASLTVFAPTNQAFEDLATALNTDINGLLELPNLSDVLLYHVLGSEVASSAISNGDVVDPLSPTNSLKLSVTSGGVFVNQALVSTADVTASNGVVHVLNQTLLPGETVIDVAIDNGFTTLVAAVAAAELTPTLSDIYAEYTVFAPTNEAFEDLAGVLGVDVADLLELPDLADILLYHVVSGTVLSTDLSNGLVETMNGDDIAINIDNGVVVNNANVTLADVTADYGVVHVVDAVIVPAPASVDELESTEFSVFPNPASEFVRVENMDNSEYQVLDIRGAVVDFGRVTNDMINVSNFDRGTYILRVNGEEGVKQARIVKF